MYGIETFTPVAYSHPREIHIDTSPLDWRQLSEALALIRKMRFVGIAPKVALHQVYGDLNKKSNLEALFTDAESLGFKCSQSGLDIVFTPTDISRGDSLKCQR